MMRTHFSGAKTAKIKVQWQAKPKFNGTSHALNWVARSLQGNLQ